MTDANQSPSAVVIFTVTLQGETMDRQDIGRREWIVASGSMALAACASGSAQSPTPRTCASPGDIDIPRLLQLASVPGMAIATVRGADVAVEGIGVRRSDASDAVTGDTV